MLQFLMNITRQNGRGFRGRKSSRSGTIAQPTKTDNARRRPDLQLFLTGILCFKALYSLMRRSFPLDGCKGALFGLGIASFKRNIMEAFLERSLRQRNGRSF